MNAVKGPDIEDGRDLMVAYYRIEQLKAQTEILDLAIGSMRRAADGLREELAYWEARHDRPRGAVEQDDNETLPFE